MSVFEEYGAFKNATFSIFIQHIQTELIYQMHVQ